MTTEQAKAEVLAKYPNAKQLRGYVNEPADLASAELQYAIVIFSDWIVLGVGDSCEGAWIGAAQKMRERGE